VTRSSDAVAGRPAPAQHSASCGDWGARMRTHRGCEAQGCRGADLDTLGPAAGPSRRAAPGAWGELARADRTGRRRSANVRPPSMSGGRHPNRQRSQGLWHRHRTPTPRTARRQGGGAVQAGRAPGAQGAAPGSDQHSGARGPSSWARRASTSPRRRRRGSGLTSRPTSAGRRENTRCRPADDALRIQRAGAVSAEWPQRRSATPRHAIEWFRSRRNPRAAEPAPGTASAL
jgi:hypothetical protein